MRGSRWNLCCLTFELSCDRRYCVFAPYRKMCTAPCAGQKHNAVGRQLERGVSRHHRNCSAWSPMAEATFSSVALRGSLTRSICA